MIQCCGVSLNVSKEYLKKVKNTFINTEPAEALREQDWWCESS